MVVNALPLSIYLNSKFKSHEKVSVQWDPIIQNPMNKDTGLNGKIKLTQIRDLTQ